MEDSTTSGWDSAMDTTLANGFPRHTGVGIDILQRERESHTNNMSQLMYYSFNHGNTQKQKW